MVLAIEGVNLCKYRNVRIEHQGMFAKVNCHKEVANFIRIAVMFTNHGFPSFSRQLFILKRIGDATISTYAIKEKQFLKC